MCILFNNSDDERRPKGQEICRPAFYWSNAVFGNLGNFTHPPAKFNNTNHLTSFLNETFVYILSSSLRNAANEEK